MEDCLFQETLAGVGFSVSREEAVLLKEALERLLCRIDELSPPPAQEVGSESE